MLSIINMATKYKSEEELRNQYLWFLDYEVGKKIISKDKSVEIMNLLSDKELITLKKEKISADLANILNQDEFDHLYEDYKEYLKLKKQVSNLKSRSVFAFWCRYDNLEIIKNIWWIVEFKDLLELKYIIENTFPLCTNWIIESLKDQWINDAKDILIELKKLIESWDEIIKMRSCFNESYIKNNIAKKYWWLTAIAGKINEDKKQWNFENERYPELTSKIMNSGYNKDIKFYMLKKIHSVPFDEANAYLRIFVMFDESISMDVQRIKNELVDELLKLEKFEEVENISQEIIDIFIRNNLPLTWKIFMVFKLLYPKGRIESLFSKYPNSSWKLHKLLNEWNKLYELIYKDLMNIAIKSWDRSLKEYVETFVSTEELLKKFEWIISMKWFKKEDVLCLEWKLKEDEQVKLLYLFRKISVLYSRYYWKDVYEDELIENIKFWESTVMDNLLISFYNNIRKGFHLREWESVYERLEIFLRWIWYKSFEDVLNDMIKSKEQAHERWLQLYNSNVNWKILFPRCTFKKWITADVFEKIIERWIVSSEYLWWWDDWISWNEWGTGAWSTNTPFDIDWRLVNSNIEDDEYWNISLIINTKRDNFLKDYECFPTYLWNTFYWTHYWIRTWVPMTEVDYIIYNWPIEVIKMVDSFAGKNSINEELVTSPEFKNMCYEIARNGYYIPIVDKEWNIIFTPEMYHKIRIWFNYMNYYDWFDVELNNWEFYSKKADNDVNMWYLGVNDKCTNEKIWKLMREYSLNREKYRTIEKNNTELLYEKVEFLKMILEQNCWIKFNSEYDESLTWAELYVWWTIWRWINIPSENPDFSFTLVLDDNDYKWKLESVEKTLLKETKTVDSKWSWKCAWWYLIKSNVNRFLKDDEDPGSIPLNILILKKSEMTDYSSDEAVSEKIHHIKNDLWVKEFDFVRTNILIMGKLLKWKWWIDLSFVENWIIQNHGSFIEALESFEKTAYWWIFEGWKKPLSIDEFRKRYPIYDGWKDYKEWEYFDYIYMLNKQWYSLILQIVQTLRIDWIDWIRKLLKLNNY